MIQIKPGTFTRQDLSPPLGFFCLAGRHIRRHNFRLLRARIYTSIKIIKNEVGCRDDTVPKTVGTSRGVARIES